MGQNAWQGAGETTSSLYTHSPGELAILGAFSSISMLTWLIVPSFYLQTKLDPQFQICIANSLWDIPLGGLLSISDLYDPNGIPPPLWTLLSPPHSSNIGSILVMTTPSFQLLQPNTLASSFTCLFLWPAVFNPLASYIQISPPLLPPESKPPSSRLD